MPKYDDLDPKSMYDFTCSWGPGRHRLPKLGNGAMMLGTYFEGHPASKAFPGAILNGSSTFERQDLLNSKAGFAYVYVLGLVKNIPDFGQNLLCCCRLGSLYTHW